ncbi:MAG: hypothetical protein ABI587_15285 [Gemmatimonadales bacterium]
MFRPARLFRSNLLALVLLALVLGTAACFGEGSTESNSNGDYCTQHPENC